MDFHVWTAARFLPLRPFLRIRKKKLWIKRSDTDVAEIAVYHNCMKMSLTWVNRWSQFPHCWVHISNRSVLWFFYHHKRRTDMVVWGKALSYCHKSYGSSLLNWYSVVQETDRRGHCCYVPKSLARKHLSDAEECVQIICKHWSGFLITTVIKSCYEFRQSMHSTENRW